MITSAAAALPAGPLGETVVADRAAAGAGAFVAADAHEPPGAVVDVGKLRPVAGVGLGGEHPQPFEEVAVETRAVLVVVELEAEPVVGLRLVEPLEAQVVGAALEHGVVDAAGDPLGEKREVLAGELVLERLGGRGHDRRLAGERGTGTR